MCLLQSKEINCQRKGMGNLRECRVCDGRNLEPVVDLGQQPWANHFLTREEVGKEPYYPLRVLYCHDCATTQLDYTVPKEVMFCNHTYLSGITQTLSDHFRKVAEEVDRRFFANFRSKKALDIGSNDGTQLKHYQKLGYEVLGVESSKNIARIASERGIPTLNAFFNYPTAQEINGKFQVINAAGIFFHLEELHSFTRGVKHLLDNQGVFVVQFLYMKSILENLAFDQIYHEHLLYYNLETIEKLLNRHQLAMFDAYLAPIHGGSIIGFISPLGKQAPTPRLQHLLERERSDRSNDISTYQEFARRIADMKTKNLYYLGEQKKQGRRIYGFGAPVKGNTLLNYFGIGVEYLDFLVEKNPLRKGLYSPGRHIPVILENEITQLPDVYYVLAWNFKKEILQNNQELIKKGIEFYFPIEPRVL